MKNLLNALLITIVLGGLTNCKKKTEEPINNGLGPKLIFKFQFDSTQQRLNNFGTTAVMPAGHAGQNPKMNKMSAHYIELAGGALTPLGGGAVLYHAEETAVGGANAINFSKNTAVGNGQEFFSIPLKSVTAGDYEYLRVSLAYQNYDIKYHIDTVYIVGGVSYPVVQDFTGTLASFVGFNTYLTSYTLKTQSITVNGNRKQGYWGFESIGNTQYPFNYLSSGQAPAGATTVVNPIAATSPIPAGSCVVTGPFAGGKLKITGTETKDIIVIVSLSTNKSFEWNEVVADGKWEPGKGENIVDMGLRGLIPIVQ